LSALKPGIVFNLLSDDADEKGITGDFSRDEELQFFEAVGENNEFNPSINYQDDEIECRSELPLEQNTVLSVKHHPGTKPEGDRIVIRNLISQWEYTKASTADPFLYCRTYSIEDSPGVYQERKECIKFYTAWKYEVIVLASPDGDSERECFRSTYEAVNKEESVEKPSSPGLKSCLAEEGVDYKWWYTKPEIEVGSRATLCKYIFYIDNDSKDNLKLMLFESFDNRDADGEGMNWDHWQHVQLLEPYTNYEYKYSNTRYENGTENWAYGTMFLVMYDTPECFPFTIADKEENLIMWEENSTPLDNPCW
jgi:hypothetical protein